MAESGAENGSAVRTKISGGTSEQRALLRQILGRMGQTRIASARIEHAGAFWTPYDSNSVVLKMTLSPGAGTRGDWEADLVGYGFADTSRELDLPRVTAYETPSDGISVDGPDPQPLPTSLLTRFGLEQTIHAEAAKSGARVVALEILEPRLLAAVVTLQVDDPAAFLKQRAWRFLAQMQEPELDGLLVQLLDGEGKLVWSTVDGIQRADLEGCDPIPKLPIELRFEVPPPPCPVD